MQEIVKQQAIGQEELIFYGLCFLLGSAAGLFRTARDNDFLDLWNLVNISVVSGFLSFSVISILYRWFGNGSGDEFYFLGVASLLGLLGKDLQQKVIASLLDYVSGKFGLPKERDNVPDRLPEHHLPSIPSEPKEDIADDEQVPNE